MKAAMPKTSSFINLFTDADVDSSAVERELSNPGTCVPERVRPPHLYVNGNFLYQS